MKKKKGFPEADVKQTMQWIYDMALQQSKYNRENQKDNSDFWEAARLASKERNFAKACGASMEGMRLPGNYPDVQERMVSLIKEAFVIFSQLSENMPPSQEKDIVDEWITRFNKITVKPLNLGKWEA